MQNFHGKVAFITDGGSGVGFGQARVFSRAGAKVVLAEHVLEAVRRNELYIIPYRDERERLRTHFCAILAALQPADSDLEGQAKRRAVLAR